MRLLLLLLWCLSQAYAVDQPQGGRWVEAVLTAYSPLDDHTRDDVNNPDRLTSTGKRTADVPYGVAADPRSVPYGAQVYIPVGLGYLDESRPTARCFCCDDTGSVIKRRTRRTGVLHIDLRFKSVESAIVFGTKKAWIYIYDPK